MSEHWEAADTVAVARAMRFTRHRAAIQHRCLDVRGAMLPLIHRPAGVRVENWTWVRRVFNLTKVNWEQFA